jgi:hypothetical protein
VISSGAADVHIGSAYVTSILLSTYFPDAPLAGPAVSEQVRL